LPHILASTRPSRHMTTTLVSYPESVAATQSQDTSPRESELRVVRWFA